MAAVAEQVRRGRGGREHPRHELVGGLLDGSPIGHRHRLGRQESGPPEYLVLTGGRGVADAASGPPVSAQVATAKPVEGVVGRRRERKRARPALRRQLVGSVTGRVHLHHRPARVEHRRDRRGHPGPVHPVERRGEGHRPEGAEPGGQVLGPAAHPVGVADAQPGRGPRCLRQHLRIGVEADDRLEQRRQPQGDRSRPAADVEQPPPPVQTETAGQDVGQTGGVGSRPCW